MSESRLTELQHLTKLARESADPDEAIGCISEAFTLFSEEAAELKIAYAKLQEKYLAVNQELIHKVERLERVTGYLDTVLRSVGEGICFVALDGTVVLFNSAAENLLGISGETVLFKKVWDVWEDGVFGFSLREALRFGLAPKMTYKTLSGKELEIGTSFVYEGPKNRHGLAIVLRDITEMQKLQLIAHRNERIQEIGEMAATVAHEIRNPLGGIRGYASLLYRDLTEQPPLQELAAHVIEGTKQLENLVTSVLQYARPVQIAVQSVELGNYLRQIMKFVKMDPIFPDGVKVVLHIPFEPVVAPIDPERLKGALLNLIFNGLQAMSTGGTLTLSLSHRETVCQIEVGDTGVGIDEEQMKRLFSRFFTTKQTGNGLGLVEAQKIVQAHQGTIEVRSQPGRGTVFTITLPRRR